MRQIEITSFFDLRWVENTGVSLGLLSAALFGAPQPYAPVKYGVVWNLEGRRWVHWDGNTQSPIGRNLLAALTSAAADAAAHEALELHPVGEAGVGKSRLVAEIGGEATQKNARTPENNATIKLFVFICASYLDERLSPVRRVSSSGRFLNAPTSRVP